MLFRSGEYDAERHELSVVERGRSVFERLFIPIPGAHNAMNLLASIALARLAGGSFEAIRAGLGAFRPPAGRMDLVRLGNGWRVIDDSYNANPESMRAAIGYLAGQPGERLAVVGSMGELGGEAESLHQQLGEFAAGEELDAVIAVGPGAEAIAAGFRFAGGSDACIDTVRDSDEAAEALHARLADRSGAAVTVLLKGSRFMHIERVREALEREHGIAPGRDNESTGRGRDAALAD